LDGDAKEDGLVGTVWIVGCVRGSCVGGVAPLFRSGGVEKEDAAEHPSHLLAVDVRHEL
jgi:hypothetical protein